MQKKNQPFLIDFGAAEGIRTPNLLIRSQMRYPITPQLRRLHKSL